MKLHACLLVVMIAACGPTPHRAADDDTSPDAGDVTNTDAAACVAEAVSATQYTRPVDILWVIDNSGSMNAEEQRVQNNMNVFSSSIANSGVDYHVIVITDTGHVNVPPPLGGSASYLGLNQSVGSNDALQKLVERYPDYQSFLRPDSIKHIVAVTDDNSDWSRQTFETQLAALTAPGFGTDWRFHAIVAEDPPFDFNSHCFALAAAVGSTYIQLQQAHSGEFFSLCDTNWDPLFPALADSVVAGSTLPCTFEIPPPPDGMSLDPNQVNFVYTPTGGTPITLNNVGSMAGCAGGPGWYYDDPVTPTQILLCPSSCSTVEGDPTGTVNVEFGCSTVVL